MPLTSEQLNFKVSNGKLLGNSVWIDWNFKDDSVKVEVELKKDPAAMQQYIQTGSEQFLPRLREEKKKYGWDKMTAAVLQLAAAV